MKRAGSEHELGEVREGLRLAAAGIGCPTEPVKGGSIQGQPRGSAAVPSGAEPGRSLDGKQLPKLTCANRLAHPSPNNRLLVHLGAMSLSRLFREFFGPKPASILVACLLAVLIGSAAQRTRCTDCTVARDNLHAAHLLQESGIIILHLLELQQNRIALSALHCVLCAGAPSPLLKTFVIHQAKRRGPANGVPPGFPPFLAVNGRLPPRP